MDVAGRAIQGKRKAAALLITLGPELSAMVLKIMREDEIDTLTNEIVRMERIPSEVRDSILQETYEEAMTRQYITEGGA
ncbi:MAG: flagellar motor switch protein FliG, partial [Chloroflexi bacterium]|nr:flagellar motor switch protein FliG [Chloroflexota bacterium]